MASDAIKAAREAIANLGGVEAAREHTLSMFHHEVVSGETCDLMLAGIEAATQANEPEYVLPAWAKDLSCSAKNILHRERITDAAEVLRLGSRGLRALRGCGRIHADCILAAAQRSGAVKAEAHLTGPDGLLTEAGEALWGECERNAIDEIVARVHHRGGDAVPEFWAWWEQHKGDWLGPHRAAGAWLREQRADAVRALVEACDAWMEHVDVMDATVIAAGGRPGTEQESAYRRIVSAARSTLRAVKGEKP